MTDQENRTTARYKREKVARKEAERLLEGKSRELYQTNLELKQLAESLETKVLERTEDLEIARDEAIQSAKVKSEFLANMSHELRTPMNGVLGMLNLLSDTNLNSRQSKLVSTARQSGELLFKLINDILDITKLEEDKLKLENLPFGPTELLEYSVEPFFAQASNKGTDLLVQIPPSLPKELLGDPTRIQQIVTNLVSNALKFTNQGNVIVQAFHSDSILTVRVADSGVGMTEEQQNKIFSAFSQADESTTRKYGGTGLGLSICRHLVSLMGGEIKVESQLNQGSTFTVELPLKINLDSQKPQLPKNFVPQRVLIAESNEVNRLVLEECLRYWEIGHVEVVANSPELLNILQKDNTKHSLLIIDDVLLKGDRNKLIRQLVRKNHELNIVMYTDVSQLKKHDSNVFRLTKPIKQSELYNTIASLCGLAISKVKNSYNLKKIRFVGQKILLVEDNETNQEVAKELLSIANLDVTIANNGQEAIDEILKNNYDLVLMDIQMPVMDGLTATKKIRAIGSHYAKLPIVAMTAHGLQGDREKSLEAGMDDHITKPIDPQILFNTLANYLTTNDSINEEAPQEEPTSALPDVHLPGIELEESLERVGGNWKLLRKILLLFASQNATTLQSIENAIDESDLVEAIRFAHTLKGSAANIGAMSLSVAATQLEELLNSDSEVNYQEKLENSLNDIKNQLEPVLNSINSLQKDVVEETTQFDKVKATEQLTTITEQVYADLSVVSECLEQLTPMLAKGHYEDNFKHLNDAYNTFDYGNIEQYANELLQQIGNEK